MLIYIAAVAHQHYHSQNIFFDPVLSANRKNRLPSFSWGRVRRFHIEAMNSMKLMMPELSIYIVIVKMIMIRGGDYDDACEILVMMLMMLLWKVIVI